MVWKDTKGGYGDSERASGSRRNRACLTEGLGEGEGEGEETRKKVREREMGGGRRPVGGRTVGRSEGGKMERLSYETQRQLPRSPPVPPDPPRFTGRDDLTLFSLFG